MQTPSTVDPRRFTSFAEFYPFYLVDVTNNRAFTR